MDIPGAGVNGMTFGKQHFGAARLGDKRRTRRLVELADLMVKHPGGTLPQKLAAPADLKALYRLMDCDAVTHAAVLAPHVERTRRVMQELGGVIVLIHDTTELDYTTKFALDGLGPIGKGTHRGYLCHHSLAVTADRRQVLGLTSQILHTRPEQPKRQRKRPPRLKVHREDDNRESRLWIEGFQNSGPATSGVKVIDVCDRGADTFEVLSHEVTHGRSFVIRSTHDRALLVDPTHRGPAYLHQYARTLPSLGTQSVAVQGNLARTGRAAVVAIAAAPVTIAPPKQKRGQYESKPVSLWVVRVWELDPPKEAQSEAPLEWILLTSEPGATFDQAQTAVNYYECRPVVEELHKGQKTGCNLEHLQFTRAARLEPAIALLTVVALSLLQLRDASRRPDAKERRATEFVHRDYVEVLCAWRHQQVRSEWTLHDFYYALARLGGHQNRKSDHPPGWLILWRGWTKLQAMVTGADLARRRQQRCG